MAGSAPSELLSRRHQMFPMLVNTEIARIRRFGSLQRHAVGDELVTADADGTQMRARTVVAASGARYRRPAVPRLHDFEGRGVWYWASAIEARLCAQSEVALAGGGNSAGQAAVFLAAHASRVSLLLRGPGLTASMSRYLIDRIEATPNIEVQADTEVATLHGKPDTGLQSVSWRNRRSGDEVRRPVRKLFMFVGADPETAWLDACGVAVDGKGFVYTGKPPRRLAGARPHHWRPASPALSLWVMCARVRSSVWAALSAKAPR